MSYSLYLSYSGLHCYKTCPKMYWFRYVEKSKVLRDPRDAMFGSVIGKVFEWFYERRAWLSKDPVQTTLSYVEAATNQVFASESFDPSSDRAYCVTLKNDLETYVPGGVETIRRFGLLTPRSIAELDLTQEYSRDGVTLKLGGKADFVHPSDTGVSLVDGKGSKYRGTYSDPLQLIWYATLYYLRFGVAPVKVGFLFWRFPSDPIQWLDYDESDMRRCVGTAFETAGKIRLKMFDAKTSSECRRCDYRASCPEGTSHVADMAVEAPARINTSVFDVERVV